MRRPYSSMTELTPSRVNFGEWKTLGGTCVKFHCDDHQVRGREMFHQVIPGRAKKLTFLRRSCIIIHQVRGGSNGLAADVIGPATDRQARIRPAKARSKDRKARGA